MAYVPVLVVLLTCVAVFVGFAIRRHLFLWTERVVRRRRLRQGDWDNNFNDRWEDQVVEGDWRGDRVCRLCGRRIPLGEWGFADGPLCHPSDPELPDCYRLWTVDGIRPIGWSSEATRRASGVRNPRRRRAAGGEW